MSDYVIAQNLGEPKDENGQLLGRDLLEPLVALPAEWTDLRLHQAADGTISITELEQATWSKYDRQLATLDNVLSPSEDHTMWRDVPVAPTPPPPHDCSNCGASVADCDAHVKTFWRGCCGLCVMMDTHGLIPKGA